MNKTLLKSFLIALFVSFSGIIYAQSDPQDQTKQTRISSDGHFEVTMESLLQPLKLGRMHAWKATVTNTDGKSVTNATFTVGGGMPIHNHGFPTQPEMTKQIEPGVYLIEGFKFSMNGPWIILLDISSDDRTDTVAFDIDM